MRTETSGLEATLGNINNNMAKMSSLLEMMCSSRQQSTEDYAKSPTAKRQSVDSLHELSRSDDNYSPPLKRFECYQSDDDVSLYADDDDDLDCDSSIQKLTERKNSSHKVTDREGGKKPTTLPKSLVDSFQEGDATGDDIDPDVAELLKKRCGKKT